MYRRYILLVAFSWVEESTHWDKRILFSSLLSRIIQSSVMVVGFFLSPGSPGYSIPSLV